MTKNSYFIFISIIGIIITVTISTFFWEHIKLEFNNYEEVLGSYSESSHNQHNDTLRFLSFISFPLIFYFILCMVFYKKDFIGNIKNLFNDEYEVNFQEKNNIKIYLYFFLALIIFGFFLTDLPLSEIDIFHEGQRLGGGYNFHTTGKLWTHNYINTSLFMDIPCSSYFMETIWSELNRFGKICFYINKYACTSKPNDFILQHCIKLKYL